MRSKDLPPELLARVEAVAPSDPRRRADRMVLILPFPPSTNHLYRSFVANGRVMRAKTPAAQQYAEFVGEMIDAWTMQQAALPPAGPYQLILTAWPPADKRRHDLSNLFKCVEDGIFEKLRVERPEADDDEVNEVHGYKQERSPYPCIEVQLARRPKVAHRPHPGVSAIPIMLPSARKRRAASARTAKRSTIAASA